MLKNKETNVPINKPVLEGNEKKYILEALDSGWISSEGPFVEKFEGAFSNKVNRKYGISVSSGSAALDIAVKALDIGPGDEVIMPTFTIISCASAVIKRGAIPIYIDSDPITWNMDINDVEGKITEKTKAIMAVHIYGLPVDMDPLLEISKKYNLYIIEDAAQMHGQLYKGKFCGSFGDISTFSFYANKHITTGEGGMLVTDNESIRDRCRSLRNLCFQKNQRFFHEELGWNYRFTNLQAAIGLAQLERLNEIILKKKKIGIWYNELLQDLPQLILPLEKTEYAENIYWVYGVVLSNYDINAVEIITALKENGIGARPFFYPMHKQPILNDYNKANNDEFPVSEELSEKGFYLPSGLGLKQNDIKIVTKVLIDILD